MVTLDQIQAYMRERIGEDQERRFVNVSGDTLEDALQQAAIELGISVKQIEYELVDRGARGVLGMGRKPCLILAYPAVQAVDADAQDSDQSLASTFDIGDALPADVDGRVFVRLAPDGVMLKVTKPIGSGSKATERAAVERLLERIDEGYDKSQVAKVVKAAQGDFVKVAPYQHDPTADASLTVEIADLEMTAYLFAYPPGDGGADPSRDEIVTFLNTNGIVEGLDHDAISQFVDDPVYRERVKIAKGGDPVNGANARVAYSFELEPGQVQLKEKNGRVDFRELNLVQNVVADQVLARKIPAERGEPGTTVTGKMLPATDGKDIEMPTGRNVRLSSDGMTALAEINGQVVITAGKIVVEPVHVINGDVNLRSGNILFLGTVVIKGNVDDGFVVKAAGNIEVMGSVGRSTLDAEGDIIVHQGIAGKTAGRIRCGKSVWAKFIENARVEAGNLVVVSDGIIASTILADRKIICKGRRASIVGGQLKAVEEIDAKTLGSVAGSETILEVGYDPKRREKLAELEKSTEEFTRQLEEIKLNMSTIESSLKSGRSISDERKAYYQDLKEKRITVDEELKKNKDEVQEIREYLSELRVSGKISASGTVYPGVKVSVKDAFLEVRNEFRTVSFIADNETVKVTKYEESDEDLTINRRG